MSDQWKNQGQRRGGPSLRDQIKRRLAFLTRRHDSYQSLFMDKGELTPAAEYFFRDLARMAGLHERGFEPDARRADWKAAQRDLIDRIIDNLHLDGAQLAELNRRMRETDQ